MCKHLFLITSAFLISFLAWRVGDRFFNPNLRVLFFDIGQGDASLIRFPYGKTLLIDGGKSYGTPPQTPLFLELTKLNILTLDAVLMTHPDRDHSEGLLPLLERLEVRSWWQSSFNLGNPHPMLIKLTKLKLEKKTPSFQYFKEAGFKWNGVGGKLIPLNGNNSNDRSLLLELSFAGCRLFFSADIEENGERQVLRKGMEKVDILKVAHHGSKTSSHPSFLQVASPRFAVISVGKNNSYGHPHLKTLENLKRVNAQIFRTDFHGFVEFTITPKGEIICESSQGSCGHAICGLSHTLKPNMASF